MDIDKKLVQNTELTFLKENLTKTLLLNDDGIVELYEEGKLIDSKPFSKINVERDYKKIIQEGYILVEDLEDTKYNIYLLCGEDGIYNSRLICTVDSEEQAQDRVAELEAENGCGAYYEKVDGNGKVFNESKLNESESAYCYELYDNKGNKVDNDSFTDYEQALERARTYIQENEDIDYVEVEKLIWFNEDDYENYKECDNSQRIKTITRNSIKAEEKVDKNGKVLEEDNNLSTDYKQTMKELDNHIKNTLCTYLDSKTIEQKILSHIYLDDDNYNIIHAEDMNEQGEDGIYCRMLRKALNTQPYKITNKNVINDNITLYTIEKKLEEDNQNIQQDLDQTEQELKDDIEQVDRAQELKDELETKLDKLYNENKDIKTDLGIEPGSDEEAKLDDLLNTDYDLVWDDLDEDEKEQYNKVASTIRRLKPDEALIDVIDEINNKAKENKLEKDILLYIYLKNNKKTESNEYKMTPIPDELKQPSQPKGWTNDMYMDYYYKMANTVAQEYKNNNIEVIKTRMKNYGVKDQDINDKTIKNIINDIAFAYADEKQKRYKEINENKETENTMPTGPHTSKKLSKQEILDMNQIPVSEKQVKYLTNLGITEEDIIVGLQDLVKQMKYLDDNKPFISIEEYVNEVTKF